MNPQFEKDLKATMDIIFQIGKCRIISLIEAPILYIK